MLQKLIEKTASYIKYRLKAKGLHGIHSPFVFEFASKVLYDRTVYEEYHQLSRLRKRNFTNRNVIETVDFGAVSGNRPFETYHIRVNKLSKKRSPSLHTQKLLFRISRFFKPENILEFGTSTGLSTVSLALGNPDSKLTTMEGCASVANVAEGNFNAYGINNIHIAIGNFNQILIPALSTIDHVDLVFFDGNHRKKPTIDYFHQCLLKAKEDSIFIFDDIHWSEEMDEAWNEIINHPQVRISIDLFQLGIVFFKTGIEKQHFVLRNN